MTLKEYYRIHDIEIRTAIRAALREDRISDDITTGTVLEKNRGEKKLNAVLLCKQDCFLSGIEIFKRVFREIDSSVKFKGNAKDGEKLRNNQKVLEVKASLTTLLRGERTALNFIQRMSGIATLTNYFVKRLKYSGSHILHTRKTTPNFRVFEIAAVKTGGGDFHRQDLSSAVMIKDNHIEAAGSITEILNEIRKTKSVEKIKHRFEVEVKTMKEVNEVVKAGKGLVEIVMLDNFGPSKLDEAIKILKQNRFRIEVSGGVNVNNFDSFQRKGIDYYSLGMLTHSYNSADFSLEF